MAIISKQKIVEEVKKNRIAVAWLTERGAIVHVPNEPPVAFVPNATMAVFDDPEFPFPILVVKGATGLVATQPQWDGIMNGMMCKDPDCRIVHDIDQVVHDELWERAEASMRKQ